MIGVVGHMSGGKTYYCVKSILGNLLDGHIVCSNIRLKCRGVSDYLRVPCVLWKQNYYYLSDSDSGFHVLSPNDYDNYPAGSPRGTDTYQQDLVYIYIDEASSYFDSIVQSGSALIQHVAAWARHTEKRGQIVYLIMQFSSDLHKRLRNHITEYISCTNSTNLRLPLVHLRLPPFLRNKLIVTRYAKDEETVLESSKWGDIEKPIYSCYNTAQIVVGNTFTRAVLTRISKRDFELFKLKADICLLLGLIILLNLVGLLSLYWLYY